MTDESLVVRQRQGQGQGYAQLEKLGLVDEVRRPIVPAGFEWINDGAIIFQKKTKEGYPFDIAVSALQKCIRRGSPQAFFFARSLCSMNGIFLSHCINRLAIIASEDIGIAWPDAPIVVG